jgi:hypothetical protein
LVVFHFKEQPMRAFQLPLFAALAGCTTLSAPLAGPADTSLRLAVGAAEAGVRRLVLDLSDPAATPDFAATVAALDSARVAVATDAILSGADFGLALQAERAALGVTLAVCADGVGRMASAEPAAAAGYARGTFAFTCLAPLGVFGGR